ncbi:MAG: response regulator [Nitrospinae bacterium]|nr:response regulator [Nitrospinota bacterium]
MSEIIVARRGDDPLGAVETLLAEGGERFATVPFDLSDARFGAPVEERETGVVIARFHEDDLASLKAMQALQMKKPGIGVIFVTARPLSYPVMSLLFNEGCFGLLTEPLAPESALAQIRKGIKRSRWKQENIAENIELKRLNARLTERIAHADGESARERDLRQRLENLVHYLLSEPGFRAKAIKILVVSDSGYQRGVLSELLGKIGFTLKVDSSGEQARDTIKSFEPNIVVSDLELPGISGVDLAKEVKGTAGYPPLHFIIMTSSAEKRNWILTPDTRVDDCVIKPVDPANFRDMIARIALGVLTV